MGVACGLQKDLPKLPKPPWIVSASAQAGNMNCPNRWLDWTLCLVQQHSMQSIVGILNSCMTILQETKSKNISDKQKHV